MIGPLRLPEFPTVGPAGERDNLERLAAVFASLMPRGTVFEVQVQHGGSCPCARGDRPMVYCDCDTVAVTVHSLSVPNCTLSAGVRA